MAAISNVWAYFDAVVPTEDALAAAVEAARRSGATLDLVSAIGRSEDPMFRTSFGLEILRIVREDRLARLRHLERAAREALGTERVRAEMLDADVPWHGVVLHALARAPDLLVVPARRGAAVDPATQHLFRKAPVPVWSVRPGRAPFPRRVLAAVDPGPAGSRERGLARRVVELALRLAGEGPPLELHVAHAWGLLGEGVLRARFGARAARLHLERQRTVAQAQLAELLEEVDPRRFAAAVHLVRGDPARAIPSLVARVAPDLVALGSTRRSGLAGFLIGSTAESLVATLACSVVVVKPDGFVSPVRPSGEVDDPARAA